MPAPKQARPCCTGCVHINPGRVSSACHRMLLRLRLATESMPRHTQHIRATSAEGVATCCCRAAAACRHSHGPEHWRSPVAGSPCTGSHAADLCCKSPAPGRNQLCNPTAPQHPVRCCSHQHTCQQHTADKPRSICKTAGKPRSRAEGGRRKEHSRQRLGWHARGGLALASSGGAAGAGSG